jgi:hypothetical protein
MPAIHAPRLHEAPVRSSLHQRSFSLGLLAGALALVLSLEVLVPGHLTFLQSCVQSTPNAAVERGSSVNLAGGLASGDATQELGTKKVSKKKKRQRYAEQNYPHVLSVSQKTPASSDAASLQGSPAVNEAPAVVKQKMRLARSDEQPIELPTWCGHPNTTQRVCNLRARVVNVSSKPSVELGAIVARALPEGLSVKLLHIGKCGGSTLQPYVKNEFRERRGRNVTYLHLKTLHPYQRDRLYIIAIRNPIRRVVSAFYDRMPFYDHSIHDTPRRMAFDARFPSVSSFAEALYTPEGGLDKGVLRFSSFIKHIAANLDHYLTDFLKSVTADAIAENQNIVVITQEALAHDAKAGLNLTISRRANPGTQLRCMTLSERALLNLRRFLAADFAAVERLNELGVLTPTQYAALSDPVCTHDVEWCSAAECSTLAS